MVFPLLPPTSVIKKALRSHETIQYLSHDDDRNENDEETPILPLQMNMRPTRRYSSFSSLSSLVKIDRGGEGFLAERKKIIMAIALFSTYFSVMGAKCALPSTFNILTSTESGLKCSQEPQQIMSRVLTISTAAIALGKFLMGPVIDKFGGTFCLKVGLSMLMIALGLIASTKSFSVFACSWIMVDFIFSICWAACLNAIHSTFPEENWASRIGKIISYQ